MLLMLGEEAVNELSDGIAELVRRARTDGKGHNLTIGFDGGDTSHRSL